MNEVINLDHPILFVFFLGMALLGMYSITTWGAKELGWNGLAALIQHP